MPDLSEYCSSLPKMDEKHIARTRLVGQLKEIFAQGAKVIAVLGLSGAGKTNLLYDFIMAHSAQCISFFIGTDAWRSSPIFFLTEMCKQMRAALSLNDNLIFDNIEYDLLKRIFLQYYVSLSNYAKKTSSIFYFVIDSLDRVMDNLGQDSIITLLPHDPFEGIRILISTNEKNKINFSHYPYPIIYFSDIEVEHYFSDLSLSKSDLKSICAASNGMPGYISHIYQCLSYYDNNSSVLLNLPETLTELSAIQWDLIKSNDVIRNVFALLTFCHEEFTLNEIALILNISIDLVKEYLPDNYFTKIFSDNNTLQFRSDAHKSFLKNQLNNLETDIILLLIKYYESNSNTRDATIHLPQLYSMSGNYNKLISMLNASFLKNAILLTRQPPLIKSHLRILDNKAFEKKDWSSLIFGVLSEAILSSIVETPFNYDEIQALLAMGKYDDALERAMRALLPEDRVYLLSCIVRNLNKSNLPISNEIFLAIRNELILINIEESNIKKLVDSAVNIFPIDISLSLSILERNSTMLNYPDMLDVMHSIVAMRLTESKEDIGTIIPKIQDDDLRDFVNALSYIKKPAQTVIEEASTLHSTNSKILLFRSWLNTHKKDIESYQVVNAALTVIINDSEYIPSLRELRQLVQPLLFCANEKEIKLLLDQIVNLKETLIRSPLDEYYYLELILSRIENQLYPPQGSERFLNVTIQSLDIYELDIKAHVLLHIINNLNYIFPDDKQLFNQIENELNRNLDFLIESSADHSYIAKRLIPELVKYDPLKALSFANSLNLQYVRNKARKLILEYYSKYVDDQSDSAFINNVLDSFDDPFYYETSLLNLLRKIYKYDNSNFQNCFSKISLMHHPGYRSYAYAYQLMWTGNRLNTVKDDILKSWRCIADNNSRIKIGFKLSAIVAEREPIFANQLFEETIRIKNNSIINSKIEIAFICVIKLLIRLIPDIRKSDANESIMV